MAEARPASRGVRPADERVFAFDDRDFRRVCRLIHAHAGINLSAHKRDMVYSRLVRRVRALGLARFSEYLDLVEADPGAEAQAFVNALTTNLTSFFREEHHFGVLAQQLLADHRPGEVMQVWCCAASTGEEPYSLAITACEAFGTLAPPVRILATDIDTTVLETAARGVYALERIDALDLPRKRRFFQRGTGPNAGKCRVHPALQELIDFRPLNLLAPDYGLRGAAYAAVFCRNVMIYFDQKGRERVVRQITKHLCPGGYLVIGHSESLLGTTHDLQVAGPTVFRKAE